MSDEVFPDFGSRCQGRFLRSGDTPRLVAPAKINLNLLVGARGADGYHPLDSLVAKVCLYDVISLQGRRDGQINFSCQGAECGDDDRNLALRAGRLLAAERKVGGADIALRKGIPVGMGLGGGSSDAAAVLAGLNLLWNLRLGDCELAELALQLGSDVPLFLGPAASRMTGRGEILQAIELHPFFAVLVLPPFGCGTADVYRQFDAMPPAEAAGQLPLELLRQPPSRWRTRLVNQLAPAAEIVQPRLDEMLSRLRGAISLPVCVTGSGSAMFVLCDDAAEAAAVLEQAPADLRPLCFAVANSTW